MNPRVLNKFLPILLWWFLPACLCAQPGWTIYNATNSPLPENSVRCIAIDNNGVKWIGTDYGLASFDDVNWNVYQTFNSGLPDNSIRCLAVDFQNNLWIGTFSGGLVKYDGAVWTVFNTINSDLPDDFVRSIAIDTLNNKWIGTIGGLAYFDNTIWTLYNTSNSILGSNNIGSIHVNAIDNSVAIGTINGGLTLIDNSTWTPYTIWNSNLPDNTILGLDADSSGILWMATPASGLSAHIGGFSFLTFNTVSSNIASNSLTAISIAPDQSIWVSSNDSGIIKRAGNNFIVYNTLNSPLPDDFVHTLITDDQGIVWAGTLLGGLVRFDESLYLPVKDISNPASIFISPIPANDFITVKTDSQKSFQLFVYDESGKTKLQSRAEIFDDVFEINTSDFEPGIYMIKLLLEGDRVLTKKFVVIH